MAIQLIQELQVYYPITQRSNMTAHIALMAKMDYFANSGQRRYIATGEVDKTGNRISSFGNFSAVW